MNARKSSHNYNHLRTRKKYVTPYHMMGNHVVGSFLCMRKAEGKIVFLSRAPHFSSRDVCLGHIFRPLHNRTAGEEARHIAEGCSSEDQQVQMTFFVDRAAARSFGMVVGSKQDVA
jgi:hypothetical protein